MGNDIKAMLKFIVLRLVQAIIENMDVTEKEALTMLYSSRLCEQLDKDSTKLWHLSVPTLFEMFREERES